jgi:hypothetical protein
MNNIKLNSKYFKLCPLILSLICLVIKRVIDFGGHHENLVMLSNA